MKGISSVPVSGRHRVLWGWIRLVLGLIQMAFPVTACWLIAAGFYRRAVAASGLAAAATAVSRYLFAGRPDLGLELSVDGEAHNRGEKRETVLPTGV